MSWISATAVLLVAAIVAFGLYAAWYQVAFAGEIADEFRQLNANLLRERFGPEGPASTSKWHRVMSSEEKRIVDAGNGVLLGLRQVALVEDEGGGHWRVVVAHQKGGAPAFEVQKLGAESSRGNGVKRG